MINLTPQESMFPIGVHETLFIRALSEDVPGLVIFGIAKPRYKSFTRDYDNRLVCDFWFGGWRRAVIADLSLFTLECKTEVIAETIAFHRRSILHEFVNTRPDVVWDARIERNNERARIDLELSRRVTRPVTG